MKRTGLLFLSGILALCADPAARAQGVTVGADILCAERLDLIAGRRCGLVVNHTARLSDGTHLVDALRSRGITIVRLFGPEHGVRGLAGAGESVQDGIDSATGIPVVSLYGKIQKPTQEMLADVDLLLYDIQDVGTRFYTYISTMAYCMEAAAERKIPFVVLDRPDPLGGRLVDGPVLEDSLRSFVGVAPIPVVYGLTVGELALYLAGEGLLAGGLRPDLTVVPLRGWNRSMRWEETGLAWIPPSPNLPTPSSAYVYPATCFLEATNLSEGRGTARPFNIIGAPFVAPDIVQKALTALRLPGTRFDTISFIPAISKQKGLLCRGIVMDVEPGGGFVPVTTGLHLLRTLLDLTPEATLQRRWFLRLMGSAAVYDRLIARDPVPEIVAGWGKKTAEFEQKRGKYLLYP
jgi:uncharacterized protein YbbC (DUF1343 family)